MINFVNNSDKSHCAKTSPSLWQCLGMVVAAMLYAGTGEVMAQPWDTPAPKARITDSLSYRIEVAGGLSQGHTPLWLNANRYGLSSLQAANGMLRAKVERPLSADSLSRWGVGYALDVAATAGFSAKAVIQQAYAEVRWLHGVLTVGAKEWAPELKNATLSSGAQTLGINARPVPQVRLALPHYWTLPIANGWLQLKGHIAYGKLTDDAWQRAFTQGIHKYAQGTLYHSKAGFLRIGNEDVFCPWSLEMGLEMASLFGGRSYRNINGQMQLYAKGGTGVSDFIKALIPGGAESVEKGTVYQNASGDQLGSWMARLNYNGDVWQWSLYADKFFEDHSSLFQLDFDGYGTAEQWNSRVTNRYLLYDFKDWMLGVEVYSHRSRFLRHAVFEYLYTKYQSGPIYHDHTAGEQTHIGGNDNFYNHYIYSGWQHAGQVMGNPLYRSPIYNTNGEISVQNNRFTAFHLGLGGDMSSQLSYRFLATWQKGWGNYDQPFLKAENNLSLLFEATLSLPKGWQAVGGAGVDFGKIYGNNYGGRISIVKRGLF